MKNLAWIVSLVWVMILLQACSDSAITPEEEIRQLIKTGVAAAEDRSLDGLDDMLHTNYLDQKGYNRKQIINLLRAYFFRHKNIHLFTRIGEIDLLTDNQAVVKLHVAMAGSAISDIDAIASLRAQIYRFELHLIKEEDWMLQHAKWAPASLADLQ